MRLVFKFFALLLCTACTVAQDQPKYASPQALSPTLKDDTYSIYERVLPSDASEWSEVQRTQWLLEETTTAMPLNMSCTVNDDFAGLHGAVKAPEDYRKEWSEVLADYDARCHERYTLDASRLHESVRINLLDAEAQKRYRNGVTHYMPSAGSSIMQAPATPEEFKGAAGLHSFSAVYFNRGRTLAAVHFGMYCGGLCGNWTWVVLQKKADGTWKRMQWATSYIIS